MITEFESQKPIESSVFSEYGSTHYPGVMRDALEFGDPNSLIKQLDSRFFKDTKSNGYRLSKNDAAASFGGGQFNQYYMRGLCLRAEAEGVLELIVYRAKPSSNPRPEDDQKLGTRLNATEHLADLRAHRDSPTHFGVPSGAHCGLSTKLP